MYKTYTMTTTVTLSADTADQAILAYAIAKGYRPTYGEMVEVDGVQEIQQLPNPVSPIDYIAEIKQSEMVDDMLSISIRQIEAQKNIEIEETRKALSQAVQVSIK